MCFDIVLSADSAASVCVKTGSAGGFRVFAPPHTTSHGICGFKSIRAITAHRGSACSHRVLHQLISLVSCMLEEWSYLPPAINNLLLLVWCHTVYFHYLESLALCLVQVMETALEEPQRSAQRGFGNVHMGNIPLCWLRCSLCAYLPPLMCANNTVQCCPRLKHRLTPLTSYCILSAGFFRTKVTGKKSGVSYTNWAQISAWRKQHEVTEHRRVPRIVLTHTWPPYFFSFLTSINGNW